MSAEVQTAAPNASGETEPTQVTEQTEPNSYAEALLKMAAEDGIPIGDVPPKAETAEPETLESEVPATEPEPETVTEEAEPEAESEPDEEKPEATKKDEWPDSAKTRVAEETAKRKRANERADKAEALVQQYQTQLQQIVSPRPVEDDPFRDINDVAALERLERSYEKAIDLAEDDPDALVAQAVEIEKKRSGTDLLERFTPEQIVANAKRKADKAIRKFIPERRDYLQQRAVQDAQAAEVYPDLKDPNSEFTKMAGQLAYSLINGQAMKAPDVLVWIARAVKGYQMEISKNGATVTGEGAKKIVESVRQKIAPAPVRSRSLPERGGGSASLEKVSKEFESRGDAESAEALVGALLSRNAGSSRRVVQ